MSREPRVTKSKSWCETPTVCRALTVPTAHREPGTNAGADGGEAQAALAAGGRWTLLPRFALRSSRAVIMIPLSSSIGQTRCGRIAAPFGLKSSSRAKLASAWRGVWSFVSQSGTRLWLAETVNATLSQLFSILIVATVDSSGFKREARLCQF